MPAHAKAAYDLSGEAVKLLIDLFVAALPVALLYSLMLLLVSGVLIIVMHRRRLYRREGKLWDRLTKLHYPLWMLIFACCGFALGMIASFQSAADRALDRELRPLLVEMVPPIQQKIIDNLPPELADKPMTGQAIYDHMIEKAFDEKAASQELNKEKGWLKRTGVEIQIAVRRYLTKLAIKAAIKRAGERLGMTGENVEFTLKAFQSIDFAEEADSIARKVTDAVKLQVRAFADGLRLQILICWIILLLLLLIEPLLYYRVILPRKREALKAAALKTDELR